MGDDRVVPGQGTTRRALFLGAGAAGASVVLAACGDEGPSGSDGGNGSGPGGEPTSPGGAAPNSLGKTGDIPVGGGMIFAEQSVVVTQPTEGDFKAFSAICTHQNCPVASVDGGTINCTCHGSKFSIADGSVKNGPASRPLPGRRIAVDGDTITLA